MDVRVGLWRRWSAEELMLWNCGAREDSWESLGLQGDQTSQSYWKLTLNIHRRIVAEAEAPIFWPPDAKSQLTGKNPDAGKDWRQKKGVAEDEMVSQHHLLNGHESEEILGDSGGQRSLVCCSPRGCKEPDTTEQLKNNNNISSYGWTILWFLLVCGWSCSVWPGEYVWIEYKNAWKDLEISKLWAQRHQWPRSYYPLPQGQESSGDP